MARQRVLHPDFFTDADLLSLSPLHRLLFAGLWCAADREGRMLDKPRDLKLKLLPADLADVDAMLSDLAGLEMVVRYEVEGVRYLFLPGFLKRQKPHPRETKSLLPPPPIKANLGAPKANLGAPVVRDMSSLPSVSESVSESVSTSGDRAKAVPVGFLRNGIDAGFKRLTGKDYDWKTRDEDAIGALLGQAHGDETEIVRLWPVALGLKFPEISTVYDYSRHWNAVVKASASPPARAGLVTQADKDAEHRAKHGVIPGVNAPCILLNPRKAKP